MTAANPRHAARALVLDEHDRILLCRMAIPEPSPIVVWVAPGGGVEPGETPLAALRRELREEVGLEPVADPVHVWHQEVTGTGIAPGHDGVVNDYFLVRTPAFTPRGQYGGELLRAEHITGFRWWSLDRITDHDGPELFSPRDLATPLAALLTDGPPAKPVRLGV